MHEVDVPHGVGEFLHHAVEVEPGSVSVTRVKNDADVEAELAEGSHESPEVGRRAAWGDVAPGGVLQQETARQSRAAHRVHPSVDGVIGSGADAGLAGVDHETAGTDARRSGSFEFEAAS